MWQRLFSFRRRTDMRLHEIETELKQLRGRMFIMDENVKKQWDLMKDTVTAAESAMDSLKKAADYLRSHQDEGAKTLADEIEAKQKELADKITEVAASGGVAD